MSKDYVRGDRGFDLTFQIFNADGTVADITGSTIKFKVRGLTATILKIDAACTITDGPNGKCKYTVLAADFDTEGDFLAELEVTYSASKIVTAQLEPIQILPDLP